MIKTLCSFSVPERVYILEFGTSQHAVPKTVLFTASYDKIMRAYSVKGILEYSEEWMLSITSISMANHQLITGTTEGYLRAVDSQGRALWSRRFSGNAIGKCFFIDIDQDERFEIVVTLEKGRFAVLNESAEEFIWKERVDGEILGAATIFPDSNPMIALGSSTGDVSIYGNFVKGRPLRLINRFPVGQFRTLTSIMYNGNPFIITGNNSEVKFWSLDGQLRFSLSPQGEAVKLLAAAEHENTSYLAVYSKDKQIEIFSMDSIVPEVEIIKELIYGITKTQPQITLEQLEQEIRASMALEGMLDLRSILQEMIREGEVGGVIKENSFIRTEKLRK